MNPPEAEERRRRVMERALEELRGVDLKEKASLGDFAFQELGGGRCKVTIPSFGGSLEMTLPGGEMSVPPRLDSLSLRVLALRYISRSCGVPVSGEWIAYRDLPGGRFYAATLAPTVEQPLAEAYGRKKGALGEAARELGARPAEFGDESRIFHPFPRTPLLIVLHWGDEEFEPQCRVLFDRCCPSYLNTDDLKILATQLAAYLLKMAGAGEEIENMLWMVE